MIFPRAPRRRSVRLAATGLTALLTLAAGACGGSQFPGSSHASGKPPGADPTIPVSDGPSSTAASSPTARPRQTLPKISSPTPKTAAPATATPPTSGPAQPPTDISLRSLVPPVDTLGSPWEDDGEQPSSRDLTNPPAACARFTPVFDNRLDSLIHEFSFLPSADGNYEEGHIAMLSITAASAAAVSDELAGVLRSSFAPCAAATAVNWFNDHDDGTIGSVSQRIVGLPVGGSTVIWRVAIAGHSPGGASITFFMDIGYLTRGATLVKIRVAPCGCRPPVKGDAELLPGELNGLRSITLRLEGRDPAESAPAPSPINLN